MTFEEEERARLNLYYKHLYEYELTKKKGKNKPKKSASPPNFHSRTAPKSSGGFPITKFVRELKE